MLMDGALDPAGKRKARKQSEFTFHAGLDYNCTNSAKKV
jgi:hypothetical protein